MVTARLHQPTPAGTHRERGLFPRSAGRIGCGSGGSPSPRRRDRMLAGRRRSGGRCSRSRSGRPRPPQTPKACGKPLAGSPPLRFDLPGALPRRHGCRRASAHARRPGAQRRPRARADRRGVQRRPGRRRRVAISRWPPAGSATTTCASRSRARCSAGRHAARATSRARSRASRATRRAATAFPLVERGLVSLWQRLHRRRGRAGSSQARAAAPDGFYGVLADDLLHPNQNQKYPLVHRLGAAARRQPSTRAGARRLRTRTRRGSHWPTRSRCRTPGDGPTRAPRPSRRSPPIRRRSTRRSPRSCSATTRTQPADRGRRRSAMLIKNEPAGGEPGLAPRPPAALDQADSARQAGVREGGQARPVRSDRARSRRHFSKT